MDLQFENNASWPKLRPVSSQFRESVTTQCHIIRIYRMFQHPSGARCDAKVSEYRGIMLCGWTVFRSCPQGLACAEGALSHGVVLRAWDCHPTWKLRAACAYPPRPHFAGRLTDKVRAVRLLVERSTV